MALPIRPLTERKPPLSRRKKAREVSPVSAGTVATCTGTGVTGVAAAGGSAGVGVGLATWVAAAFWADWKAFFTALQFCTRMKQRLQALE
ncbi:hypothetical protein ED208_11890 [Stagnimonas aquatica]|uniref:Uncharacterized protein n=1 Tax=Stagnimonas aquatica TaxID=2689987 RepID=A0A3N0V914_9GAMM|nr:hypothetical protein ED208_11890 [Stagnimonas aquatica]